MMIMGEGKKWIKIDDDNRRKKTILDRSPLGLGRMYKKWVAHGLSFGLRRGSSPDGMRAILGEKE